MDIRALLQQYIAKIDRPIKIRLLFVLPLVLWIVLYVSAPAIPTSIRPTIDVYSLYHFDVAFLHYLPSTELAKLKCAFLDVLGAIAYTLHSGWPVVFLLYMAFFRRDLILPYVNCFGMVCFLGLITQLLMPTAPPWYYYKYGFAPANYSMLGDPAGLADVDRRFNLHFYNDMFYASPVVFGSFPSLHVGWPSVLALFVAYETLLHRAFKVAAVLYVAYVSLAVMYLQHHYFVDVFGGVFYAAVVFAFLGPRKKQTTHQTSIGVCHV